MAQTLSTQRVNVTVRPKKLAVISFDFAFPVLSLRHGLPSEQRRANTSTDNDVVCTIGDVALCGLTELWVYVVAELAHRCVAERLDRTLNVVRKVGFCRRLRISWNVSLLR